MTKDQARQILLLYRPGTADAEDPEFAEALVVARRNPELARWFEQHSAVQQILRARFQEIAVPEGLREQIVSEHRAWRMRERLRRPVALAAVAVMCGLMAVAVTLLLRSPSDRTVAGFRQRMISSALRAYPPMLIETNDVREIRATLAQNRAPADFVLPKPLEAATYTGCAVLRWQNKPVSMMCFHSGKQLGPGEKSDLFLFVLDRAAVTDAPRPGAPEFSTTNRITTASWTEGDKFYLLAGVSDEAFLRRYF